MQWWMRPGPNRACAIANPSPSPPRRFVAGTRTPSKVISACPSRSWNPNTVVDRCTRTPGMSMGTSTIDCCRCFGASGSVLPITMMISARGSMPWVDHHLRPSTT